MYSYIDQDHRLANLPAEIILFCDDDAILFKAIVKHHSLELDRKIAEDLDYINLHHRRRTETGLTVNYSEFQFYSLDEDRSYRITRFDTIEDAARFLFSEPYKERGAVLVCPFSRELKSPLDNGESVAQTVSTAKALIRTSLGFSCVAVLFNDASKLKAHDTEYKEWADTVVDFTGNGFIEKGLVTRIEGSTKAMLDAKLGSRPKQNAWWCPSPGEQLQSLLAFCHWKLPLHSTIDEGYFDTMSVAPGHRSQILTARFYCFHEKEGGSRITATDTFIISIAGKTVSEGHIMDSPGKGIEPGKLCQGNVLVWLTKAVPVESRDQFVVRTMNGASVGVGLIVSCS